MGADAVQITHMLHADDLSLMHDQLQADACHHALRKCQVVPQNQKKCKFSRPKYTGILPGILLEGATEARNEYAFECFKCTL